MTVHSDGWGYASRRMIVMIFLVFGLAATAHATTVLEGTFMTVNVPCEVPVSYRAASSITLFKIAMTQTLCRAVGVCPGAMLLRFNGTFTMSISFNYDPANASTYAATSAAVTAKLQTWSATPNTTLMAEILTNVETSFGVLCPVTLPSVSTTCTYGQHNAGLPTIQGSYACDTVLATTITSNSVLETARVKNLVCNALAGTIACEKIAVAGSTVANANGKYQAAVQFSGVMAATALVAFVNAARSSTILLQLDIDSIVVGGTSVFTVAAAGVTQSSKDCTSQFIWLVFLIVLLPITFIVARQIYRKAKKGGREKIKTEYKDAQAKIAVGVGPGLTAAQQQQQQMYYQGMQQFEDRSQGQQMQPMPQAMPYSYPMQLQYSRAPSVQKPLSRSAHGSSAALDRPVEEAPPPPASNAGGDVAIG